MAISPLTTSSALASGSVHGLPGAAAPLSNRSSGSSGTKGELPFEDLVRGLIQDTSQQQFEVKDSVIDMVTGETDSIHDVVLTASKADLAFRLVMEIRNRLIASYQEIMRMQV